MEHVGRVLEKRGGEAVVLMRKHAMCEKCGRCGGLLGGADLKDTQVIVSNPIGAEVGQNVVVKADDNRLLLMAFVLYIVPLFALVAGIFAGLRLCVILGFQPDNYLFASFVGFILMALTYLLIKRWDKQKMNDERYRPVIVSLSDELGDSHTLPL